MCDRLEDRFGESLDLCSMDFEFDFRDGDFLGGLYVWLDDFFWDGVENMPFHRSRTKKVR